jgi:SLT domain-containing protein
MKGTSSSSRSQPSRGEFRGNIFGSIGRGRGGREIRCYTCGKTRHMSWHCPENKSTNQRNSNVAEAREETINVVEKEENPELGESLMLKRILVKSEKETSEPTPRKSLFRTV